MDIDLTGVNAVTDSSGLSTINIVLSISNTGDIEKVISHLKQLKGVIGVYR